jgi:tetratricopeptide (TPR) repeat protein
MFGAALLGAAGARAAEPHIGKFVSYEVEDFTITTSRGGKQAREFMEGLAKFRVTLEKTLAKRAINIGVPTHILVVSAATWQKYLQPGQNVAGWFHSGRFANYMAMDGDAEGSEATHIMFHEYTHFFLASQFAGEYPPWFNEGLAELMGYVKFTKDMVVLLIPTYRLEEARDGDWIPFDRMIHVDQNSPEYLSHKLADSFYAQAWLTVHYGFVENREFGKHIIDYLNYLNRLRPIEEAARLTFGPDLSVVDKQLREYSRSKQIMSGGLKLGDLPPVTLPEGKPVADLDAQAMLADLMLETRKAPDRVRPLVESLARHEPNSARTAILEARLARLDEDPKAFEAAVKRATSLLPAGDWLSRRELASVLLDNALAFNSVNSGNADDTERDLTSAMHWFGEAIQHNSEDVESLWGFGAAAVQLDKDLDLAETALLAAYKRAPTSPDIAMSLANLKGRQQQPEAMIPFLKDTIRFSNDHRTSKWALETLAETQQYLEERDRVEAENRKQREAYEKMRADYDKKYGKTKKKSGG